MATTVCSPSTTPRIENCPAPLPAVGTGPVCHATNTVSSNPRLHHPRTSDTAPHPRGWRRSPPARAQCCSAPRQRCSSTQGPLWLGSSGTPLTSANAVGAAIDILGRWRARLTMMDEAARAALAVEACRVLGRGGLTKRGAARSPSASGVPVPLAAAAPLQARSVRLGAAPRH